MLYDHSAWCEEGDLNPYGVHHTPLKRARLPVPPPSHGGKVTNMILTIRHSKVNRNSPGYNITYHQRRRKSMERETARDNENAAYDALARLYDEEKNYSDLRPRPHCKPKGKGRPTGKQP